MMQDNDLSYDEAVRMALGAFLNESLVPIASVLGWGRIAKQRIQILNIDDSEIIEAIEKLIEAADSLRTLRTEISEQIRSHKNT